MTEQVKPEVANDGAGPAAQPQTYRPSDTDRKTESAPERPKEIGGRKGPEPTRYGDWEKNGRCIDF